MDSEVEGSDAPAGWLTRIGQGLSRLFGARAGGPTPGDAASVDEASFHLAAHADQLFSVFPAIDPDEQVGEPSQPFCVALARAFDQALRRPDGPRVVGLLGAGGCGKSSLFNELVGEPLSRVDILPHTTRGPLAAVGVGGLPEGVLAPLPRRPARAGDRRGALDAVEVAEVEGFAFPGLVLLDLPDLNTHAARQEGALTVSLLPWLDLAVMVFSVESFDRGVLDRALDLLEPLGGERLMVFNRKGQRGPLAAGDRADLEARAEGRGAAGPFLVPDRGEVDPAEDDRAALREALARAAENEGPAARREGLRSTLVYLAREALARHERQAGRAEEVRARFVRHLRGVRRRLELDPLAATAARPEEVTHILRDMQGLAGSPLELLRRLGRGQGLTTAFRRTFSLSERVDELREAVHRLEGVDPEFWADRMRDHFSNVAGSVSHTYAKLVGEEEGMFLEPSCDLDLAAVVFDDRRPLVRQGFVTFRDETVSYMKSLEDQLLGGGGKLEGALALSAFLALVGDLMVPGGGTLAMVGGSYIVLRTVGPELAPLLTRHREFVERQRADLEQGWDLLAAGLEETFLGGDRFFGRLQVLEAAQRRDLGAWVDRLDAHRFREEAAS